jgi:hypothetical protein
MTLITLNIKPHLLALQITLKFTHHIQLKLPSKCPINAIFTTTFVGYAMHQTQVGGHSFDLVCNQRQFSCCLPHTHTRRRRNFQFSDVAFRMCLLPLLSRLLPTCSTSTPAEHEKKVHLMRKFPPTPVPNYADAARLVGSSPVSVVVVVGVE